MQHPNIPELLVILAVIALMFTGNVRRIAEVISRFRGGGPGSPSHPLPADDSRILTRKPKQKSDR
jgi:hypothetical protein